MSEPVLIPPSEPRGKLFVVVCSSGFENAAQVRSALMFASLAAAAEYRAILFCVQNAVDVMVKGAVDRHETPEAGTPSLSQRLAEAIELGVEIHCCTQVMANKKLSREDLIPVARATGAMTLIELVTKASGTLSF